MLSTDQSKQATIPLSSHSSIARQRYLCRPCFENIPSIKRWQWWLIVSLTIQTVIPNEIFFNGFFAFSIWYAVKDFFSDHDIDLPILVMITQIVALSLLLPSRLVGDCSTISPAEKGRVVLKLLSNVTHFIPNSYSKLAAFLYATLGILFTLFSLIGYFAMSISDAISVGKLNEFVDGPYAVNIFFTGYTLFFGMFFYTLFLTGKLFAHLRGIIELFFNNSHQHYSRIECADLIIRHIGVFIDTTINNFFRIIISLYSVYIVNYEGIINLGESTSNLMTLCALSTGITTYLTRYRDQFAAIDIDTYPAYFDGFNKQFLRKIFNAKSILALLRGVFLTTALFKLELLSLSPSIALGVFVCLINLYTRYMQNQHPRYDDDSLALVNADISTEQYAETLFNNLIKTEQAAGMSSRVTAINIMSQLAQAVASREFIHRLIFNALPQMYHWHLPKNAWAVDATWMFFLMSLVENNFHTYKEDLDENIPTFKIKFRLRNEPGAPGLFSSYVTPKGAYPIDVLERAQPLTSQR